MKRLIYLIFICTLFMAGCSDDALLSFFNEFETAVTTQDYELYYSLLSEESKASISEADFIETYTTIFKTMQATSLTLERSDLDTSSKQIPFSLTISTPAGDLTQSDYVLNYVKENNTFKVSWDERLIFPTMQAGDTVALTKTTATRGAIMDRNQELLASNDTLYRVGLHPAIFNASNVETKINQLASILDISSSDITKTLDNVKNPDHFVKLVDILPTASEFNEVSLRKIEGVVIQEVTGRVYKDHKAFGRLLGYVGPITAEELEANKDKGYTTTSVIGKSGIEQVYETTLKGSDGFEIYLMRDTQKVETLIKKEVVHGSDITLSIDSNLQMLTYDKMNQEKGSATAVDPTTGEILALVSSPSYNSNDFTTYMTLSEEAYRESIDYIDRTNRFTALYSPGSTFKLITAATGLKNETLDPNEMKSIVGPQWQADSSWGGYQIRRINNQTKLSLKEAIKYSDNIYFGMNALALTPSQLIEGANSFTIGQSLDIGYPLYDSQVANDNQIDHDILLADTGYGQGEILVSTLNMALAYSTLSNDGDIMNPTLVLTDDFTPRVLNEDVISSKHLPMLQKIFTSVIHDSHGTGHLAHIPNVTLAGKTGTAELKKEQGSTGSENGWFVATDLDNQTISIALMIEDVQTGLGTLGVVEIVGDILEDYLPQS